MVLILIGRVVVSVVSRVVGRVVSSSVGRVVVGCLFLEILVSKIVLGSFLF